MQITAFFIYNFTLTARPNKPVSTAEGLHHEKELRATFAGMKCWSLNAADKLELSVVLEILCSYFSRLL